MKAHKPVVLAKSVDRKELVEMIRATSDKLGFEFEQADFRSCWIRVYRRSNRTMCIIPFYRNIPLDHLIEAVEGFIKDAIEHSPSDARS